MQNYNKNILVVDLDGTLLKTDLLHESFWSAVKNNWKILFSLLFIIRHGKAAIKEYLQLNSSLNISLLPFDDKVIAYIKLFRKKGGRTVLATGSNCVFAKRISDYLKLFDEVYGSDSNINLVGRTKASFLNNKFGPNKFEYMADSVADLDIWKISKKNITVNASSHLSKAVEKLGTPCEHLVTNKRSIYYYIDLARPHQWIKNILVFLPMLASQQISAPNLFNSLMAFIAICVAASSTYIINDLLDISSDRQHQRKRFRALACGSASIKNAFYVALTLLIGNIIFMVFMGSKFAVFIAIYYILTTIYSIRIKNILLLDIFFLAGLYTLRLVLGGVATDIVVSIWLFSFSIFFFLSLAAVKRQGELVNLASRGLNIPLGRGYHIDDLPIISTSALCSGYASIIIMLLYINSPQVLNVFTDPVPLWCICAILLFWITRLVLVAQRGFMSDDPIIFASKDRITQICFLVIVCCLTLSI